jgi:SOS-response transcriptional repressor LexA
MKASLPIEAKRFKQIREELGHTQQHFAQLLGTSNIIADIERGKTKISGKIVMQLCKQFQINPLWLYGESFQKIKSTDGTDTMPKVISVNDQDNENILLVSQKAAAGYPQNIGDAQWYDTLPAFSLPLPQFRNATYRGFQVEGDSMLPNIRPNEWVLGRAVPNLFEATDRKIYIVVLKDSVLVKKLEKLEDPSKIRLISLNEEYLPIDVQVKDLQELWLVNSKIAFGLDDATETTLFKQLKESMEELKGQISNLRIEE